MLKSFDEFITERLFGSGVKRASGDEVRIEDGKRVHTKFGDIIVHNTEFDYDAFITLLLDNLDRKFNLCNISPLSVFDSSTIAEIRKGEEPLRKLINANKDDEIATVITFSDYESIERLLNNSFKIFMNQGFDYEIYDAARSVIAERLQQLPVENLLWPDRGVFRVLSDVDLEQINTSGQFKDLRDRLTLQFPGCDFQFSDNKASGYKKFLSMRIDAYTTIKFETIRDSFALKYLEQLKNK